MSLLTSAAARIACCTAMRVVLFRRLVDAFEPAAREQRPEEHRPRKDEQSKTPASMRRVRVNFPYAHQHEWDGKDQSRREIYAGDAQRDLHEVHAKWSRFALIPYRRFATSPSPPMDSVGQLDTASRAAVHSAGVVGWWKTMLRPMSSSRRNEAGAISRHMSQSMQVLST